MERKWIFPDPGDDSGQDLITRLLARRGITDKKEISDFLSERPLLTYDPFLLKDGKESAERILETLGRHERICVYGDYDADGVCAVCLLLEILGKLGDGISYYIPSRFDEGYGLNREAIDVIKKSGAKLIVTVDCGSASASEVEYAENLGLSVIVTDHHNLNERPASCLLVNPKQTACAYPEKELSGCGVAFKLAQILQRLSESYRDQIKRPLTKADLSAVLDLVAIATIGDIVPLLGENRSLVKYGLKVVNSGRRVGLAELIRVAGLSNGEIKAEQIAYGIVPHLNAGGRMLTADTGVALLTASTHAAAEEAAALLSENNRERRRIQEEDFEAVVKIVEQQGPNDLFLIIDSSDTHEGIAGIVAGKIKEKYYRPTILMTPAGDEYLKGTGRGIEGVDLYEMLSAGRRLFEKFGGHAGACGFLMKKENLPALREVLRTFAESIFQKDPGLFLPKLYIDEILRPEELDLITIKCLEGLEPYGHKNKKPVFCLQKLSLQQPVYMGDLQQHVRFTASGIACILFGRAAEYRPFFDLKCRVEICGYPDINRWNGMEKIQFVVLDMRCYND
jgi:single-stranded-DNA-specific exonuclease